MFAEAVDGMHVSTVIKEARNAALVPKNKNSESQRLSMSSIESH
jgi:hypothetical protein